MRTDGRTQEGFEWKEEMAGRRSAPEPSGPANGPRTHFTGGSYCIFSPGSAHSQLCLDLDENKKTRQGNIGIFLCEYYVDISVLASSQQKRSCSKNHHTQPGPATHQLRHFLSFQAGVKKSEIDLIYPGAPQPAVLPPHTVTCLKYETGCWRGILPIGASRRVRWCWTKSKAKKITEDWGLRTIPWVSLWLREYPLSKADAKIPPAFWHPKTDLGAGSCKPRGRPTARIEIPRFRPHFKWT